ncbi:class I adenylate-forming enzyme family protein [Rhodococcus sp. NPDC127530]|uniref:class I adenylate-forming enzyme family protein n=1 Tax=unclassified Rhodococcus (in: high G+C Gram-positive bacteria) TaxID=192944 RepID=UPI0036276D68
MSQVADVPSYPLGTVADLWNERVQRSRDSLFIQFLDGNHLPGREGHFGQVQIVTYGDVDAHAQAVRAELDQVGATTHTRVLLHMGNGLPFVAGFLGATMTGATVVPTIVQNTPHELEFTIQDSGCKVVVVDKAHQEKAEEICRRLEVPLLLVEDDGSMTWVLGKDPGTSSSPSEATAARWDDVAVIMYTSGTTSRPKGVMLSHRSLVSAGEMNAQQMRLARGDRMLCVLPLFHANALFIHLLATVATGSDLVVLRRFSVRAYWTIARAYRATVGNLSAETLRLLLREPRKDTDRDHNIDRMLFGMPLARDEVLAIEERFGVTLAHHWGLTESTGAATRSMFYRGELPADNSIGQVCPGYRVRIVREDGSLADFDETGELQIAGSGVFLGYWSQPEETEAALEGEWLRTGDLGSIDERGNVRFQGRRKDMIKVKGENVAALEVERVIGDIPSVASVAVVGRRDDIYGEVPVAYVVLTEDSDLTEHDIRAYCEKSMSSFKVPHDIHLIDEMPMTPVGKIRKVDLRNWAAGSQ